MLLNRLLLVGKSYRLGIRHKYTKTKIKDVKDFKVGDAIQVQVIIIIYYWFLISM